MGGATARPVVVPFKACDDIARNAGVVTPRVRVAPQDVDESLLGFLQA